MTDVRSRLLTVSAPTDPEAAVLVMHGGASRRGGMMVSPAQLSVLRMVPVAHAIARAGQSRLAVFRLLNSSRGWDSTHTPVQDAAWALDQIGQRLSGSLPVGLVGHSLGGRAALLSSDHDAVAAVVALCPWVYAADGRQVRSVRPTLVVHGTRDPIAPPSRSLAVARDLGRRGQVGYVGVRGARHAMLRRHADFTHLTTDFLRARLLGLQVGGPVAALGPGLTVQEV